MPKWIEFIEFDQYSKGKKTKMFAVDSKQQKKTIGIIRWYPPFRKYSFFPYPETVYETTCLKDITDFIEKLEAERKDLIKYNQVKKILLKD